MTKSRPNLQPFIMLGALAAIWIIFSVTTQGIFLSSRNFSNLVRQTTITGLLATGMVMVIVAGHIDLSVGSLVGFTGGMAAIAHVWGPAFGAPLSVAVAVLIGLLCGAITGYLVAYKNIPAFIVTLGGLMAFRGAVKGTTGGATVGPLRPDFKFLGQEYLPKPAGYALLALVVLFVLYDTYRLFKSGDRRAHAGAFRLYVYPALVICITSGFIIALNLYEGVPVPVLILLLFAGIVTFVTTMTPFGRRVYALGGNREAAFYSGIDIRRHVFRVFVIMGFLSAVAGVIYTARVGSATPDAGKILELDAIAACVIGGTSLMGGRGSIPGAMVGALIMASLDNGMSLMNVQDFIQDIIKGSILVLAVFMDVSGKKGRE
jgi:D-xylose transport system permease protein